MNVSRMLSSHVICLLVFPGLRSHSITGYWMMVSEHFLWVQEKYHRFRMISNASISVDALGNIYYCFFSSETLSSMQLFGSNIFMAQKVSHKDCPAPCVVAVNHESINILHPQTQVEIPITWSRLCSIILTKPLFDGCVTRMTAIFVPV